MPDDDLEARVRAELRAHTQGLNALRETQLEQSRALGEQRQEINGLRHEMREGFTSQGRRIDELEREMRGGFATMANRHGTDHRPAHRDQRTGARRELTGCSVGGTEETVGDARAVEAAPVG